MSIKEATPTDFASLLFAAVLVLTATACRPLVTGPGTQPVTGSCTPAPAPPPGAPSDWKGTVRSNCFDNLQRLGRWSGGTRPLRPGTSPENGFQPVPAASIGGSDTQVVVLVHGWAPGFRQAVDDAGGKRLWWSTGAVNSDGLYSSDWAWVPTAVTTSSVSECVSATGFFQQLRAHSGETVVLGFSWLDHSATGGSYSDLVEVYRSEAYTNIAGIQLANALEAALTAGFWQSDDTRLHLIGHSHGSKVATVAALTLQQRGKRVDHLTILDSPESLLTLEGNGANLLGFYLDRMRIADSRGGGGAFVDNNPSFFGVNYQGLDGVVEVNLDPGPLYPLDFGDQHSYSAAWYAGAAAAVEALGLATPLALDWPPPPATFRPALNQSFTPASGISDPCAKLTSLGPGQWRLSAGPPRLDTFGYSAVTTRIRGDSTQNVTCSPTCDAPASLTLRPGSGGAAIFRGGYPNPVTSDGYGLSFDVTWTNAAAGDYLVATVDSPEEGVAGIQEVILVMDGRSQPAGTYPVAFNADISGTLEDVGFALYLVPAAGSGVEVTVANFRRVLISGVPY